VSSSDPDRRRRARLTTATVAWLLAVLAATAIGLTAVGAIGAGIVGTGQRPLTPQEVQARLLAASAAARPAPVADRTTAEPPAAADAEALTSHGGTVLARCSGAVVEVVSVTPAQGFRVHDQDSDDRDKVELESEEIGYDVRLSCVNGHPVAEETVDD
jgi:hypothetical protein